MSLFFGKTVTSPNLVVDLHLEKQTFRKIMEIVDDLFEKSCNNNDKPWKSLEILLVKTNT